MTSLRYPFLVMAGLLLALTYLLVPFATPDVARHERTSDALRALTLHEAALQRDVLKARAGLLRNYDPLVHTVENLRHAVDTLRSDRAEIGRHVERVAAEVADQEALVEAFKSHNALLQNSLMFFGHVIQQFNTAGDRRQDAVSAEVRTLASAMLRFASDPRVDRAGDVTASLDRLDQWPADDAGPGVRELVSHGRLIVATLPEVDDRVARLLAASTAERARALHDAYGEAHAGAVARASIFGILLYIVSLALVAYVGYLFLRLRANARILRDRLDFERLIAAISAQFINLPRDRIDDGINGGLARLAAQAGVDRAHIIVTGDNGSGIRDTYLWRRPGISAPSSRLDDILGVALRWALREFEREGCIHVPDVQALPDGPEKSQLHGTGIRSWLCIPMGFPGKPVGFLALDAISGKKHWPDDDIALSRTAAEIFANAIERQRSESERDMLEARLHQAQRLESVGTLAGGIAHEFNNILAVIFGSAEMALSTLGGGSRAERHVQRIMTAGKRAQAVIDKILTFSRRTERRPRLVLAEPVVAEAVELLRASLPATVAIEATLRAGDAAVMADPTELQQVVMNLCTNGAHAMEHHGTLHVGLDTVEREEALALSHGSLPAGRYVRLSVKDTGSGIDAATLERILEPFFTTKPVGQGTGLGLSTVHGIVTQHGGALSVASRPGEGSTFQAYFPQAGERAGEVAGEQPDARTPTVPRGRGETILIVDDDAPLVPLAEEMLAALGYEAVGFDQSATALEAFRADPGRFDLVLTDDIMPEMTGTELADALHEIRPSLPVILMTAGGRPIPSHRLQAAGIREVLRKPLLSAAIAELLARHLPSPETTPAEESEAPDAVASGGGHSVGYDAPARNLIKCRTQSPA
jgi:signal transduction histidine kinase/ActR/RegA family two-component response regulator